MFLINIGGIEYLASEVYIHSNLKCYGLYIESAIRYGSWLPDLMN